TPGGPAAAPDSILSAARLGRAQRATRTSPAPELSLCRARPAATGRRPLIALPAVGPNRARGHVRRQPKSPQPAAAKAPNMADSWPRSRPTAPARSGILITRAGSPRRQNIPCCAFATDRQPTVEAAPNGGYLKLSPSTPPPTQTSAAPT